MPAVSRSPLLLVTFSALAAACVAQKVFEVTPSYGSQGGATRVTIHGEGFAQESQFQLNPANSEFGNTVKLVSSTREYTCDVERDSTHGDQIQCYTREMPYEGYYVKVLVDGVAIPNRDMCGGRWYTFPCVYQTDWSRTPNIQFIYTISSLPGEVVKARAMMFTDAYGNSDKKNSNTNIDARFLRVYMGGMVCELLKPNSDELYGLELDNENSWYGHVSCRMTGTFIGHHNMSFILDGGYGRSVPDRSALHVSAANTLAMFQTFAEVTAVTPSEGSVRGGTTVTIHGRHLADATSHAPKVLIGGLPCHIKDVADDRILCKTSEYRPNEFAENGVGGRGLQMQVWNNTRPGSLKDIWSYHSNTSGHWHQWVDSTPYRFQIMTFSTRTRGFLVPPHTGKFILHLQCDDRCELYMSNSSQPQHMEKIAYQPSYSKAYRMASQKSKDLFLEEGKPYYIEMLQQDYGGAAGLTLAMFTNKSSYTNAQTAHAIQEVQTMVAEYQVQDETQEIRFSSWSSRASVQEVQRVSLSGETYLFFSLGYGPAQTAPLSVGASASLVKAALNDLWSIKPDKVEVSKSEDNKGTHFTVTFISDRGDFAPLTFNTFGSELNISVEELTKGESDRKTFTLSLEGVPTKPIVYNATEEEVQAALQEMLTAQCPTDIAPFEDSNVKYFQDFEDEDNSQFEGTLVKNVAFCGSWSMKNSKTIFKSSYTKPSGDRYGPVLLDSFPSLCFAYKGVLNDDVTAVFIYTRAEGGTDSRTATVAKTFEDAPEWRYTCMDLLTPLQGQYAGRQYTLSELTLNSNSDFFIDVVCFAKSPSAYDFNAVLLRRKPPPFESSGRSFESVSVTKDNETMTYHIVLRPEDCASGFPMIKVDFMEIVNRGEDLVEFGETGENCTVSRRLRATAPLHGTFDLEIYGERIEGLSVNISEEDLKFALEAVPAFGEVKVSYQGTCRNPKWRVEWGSRPGNQPLIHIDSSNVVGPGVNMFSRETVEGGILLDKLTGDYFRVKETKPQAQVYINNIISRCYGDCSFMWSEDKTPVVTAISPSEGSDGLNTLLTITGTGFAEEKATVMVGAVQCNVTSRTASSQVCSLGRSVAGTFPVSVTFPSLGNSKFSGDSVLYFTYKLIVSSFSPTSGSLAGGSVMTVKGFGFGLNASVNVGNRSCAVVDASETELKCTTPPGAAGPAAVTVTVGNLSETATDSFSFDNNQTPQISSISPTTTSVSGRRVLRIEGSALGPQLGGSVVTVGAEVCVVLQWTHTNISCLLPVLPPGPHHIHTTVQDYGHAQLSDGVKSSVEYVLEVHAVSPLVGSLMGGTKLTVTGAGFSPNSSDVDVSLGGVECEVTTLEENQLQCVLKSTQTTYSINNQGIHQTYGRGYAWEPASRSIFEGDMVRWCWSTPALLNVKYSVFSVATPSAHTFEGGPFNSGAATQNGCFSYVFSAPGLFYYSSGLVDSGKSRFLQGSVKVLVRPQKSNRLVLRVAGVEALHKPAASSRSRRSSQDCVASPLCPDTNSSSSGVSFTVAPCSTPTVNSISPNQGSYHQPVHVSGSGFGNVSCAIKVTIGDEPCHVINSSNTDVFCRLSADSELPVGIAHALALRVDNLGSAIVTVTDEMQRRFLLLPVLDLVWPHIGSTNGFTRLSIHGSGFSDGVVTAGSRKCTIVSVNYTHITCDTYSSQANTGDVLYQAGQIQSSCHSNCSFEYSTAVTPTVSKLSKYSVSGPSRVEVSGVGFGNRTEDVSVTVGSAEADVLSVADDNITIAVGALPAAQHRVKVIVRSKGLAHQQFSITSEAKAILSPQGGSVEGGTLVVFTGNGFAPGNTNVTIGGKPCIIERVTPSELRCHSPPHSEGAAEVQVLVFSQKYPTLTFNYSSDLTPVVSSVSPPSGPSGSALTLTGSGFGSDRLQVSVSLNGVSCTVSSVSDSQVQCFVGNNPGGPYPVRLQHRDKGTARSDVIFNYDLSLSRVEPNQGSFGGGALLSVHGSGFDPETVEVHICDKLCVVDRASSTSSELRVHSPNNNASGSELSCVVSVSNPTQTVNVSSSFTYKSALTPTIADVLPRRGGTAGGVLLTITGSGFSTSLSDVNVTIAGVQCDVQSTNATHILCVTNSQSQSQKTKVQVRIKDQGMAPLENADFFYIDVWSSRFTWGGLPPPEKGTFAVITKNQTILLDTSTPVLKMLLIQGGTLVFDEADIELQAENILITDGGALQVGTEQQPFQHKATITLHGNLGSPELPVYGAKTLGVREGTLDLHGVPVPVPWTRLAQTADNGSTSLTLMDSVSWKEDQEIVIATTGHRHSQRENEVRTIASVTEDGRTLTLTQPLDHTHLGVEVTLPDGTTFEARAEVGLLTRNVRVRGSQNMEWADDIQACPEGFNTGEFSTQTCFQGRFGEEVGSDQFGGCIMMHATEPNKDLVIGRFEYVEVSFAGQAFRLGRYPIHWHLMGDVGYKSYVRGCAIHHTFNRAVTIHNTHRLLVEHNVIYDIMGGAFFIEDGIETQNILQYNLAVFVKQSTSLLNDDVTPAAYWVTNPNNIIRHNAAAGGTHFGFWYRMHQHPDGPSYDPNICQKNVPLGEFFNNTAHSQGWFALWIFQDYFPMTEGKCGSKQPEPAIFNKLTAWNCEKGAEWVNVGAVHFNNFLMVNNEKAGTEHKRILINYINSFSPEGGAVVSNSVIVGRVDELGLDLCTSRGIIAPLDDGLSVINTTFINFDQSGCAAIGVARIDGTCVDKCGGWAVRFSHITYHNTPNKAGFRWEHEVQLLDMDGTLTGYKNYKVVPTSGLLDPAHCSQSPDWSVAFNGSVCDDSVNFHRLAFNNPLPSSIAGHDTLLSNQFGESYVPYMKKRMTHKLGWMALLPSNMTYMWSFDDAEHITNISYTSTFYGFKPSEFVIIGHNFTQSPDRFHIVDDRNGSAAPLSFSQNQNGDWYFHKEDNTLYYMVSGKTSEPSSKGSADPSLSDVDVQLKVHRCFYPQCIAPTPPPPATLPPLRNERPDNFIRWSDASFWTSSSDNNNTVPAEGADVVIPAGQWVVLDDSTPALNRLTVNGVLEIPDDLSSNSSRRRRSADSPLVIEATHIMIQGGRLLAGSPQAPFEGELHLRLRGNHLTPDWPLPEGPNLGSKALGVFGILELYGKPSQVYHTKLSASSAAGTNTLALATAVDWTVGDEVAISTTSYDAWETEKHVISAVSQDGLTLTLDTPLAHTHIGETHTVAGSSHSYTLAADVALLSRNIKIIGAEYEEMEKESFGARVLVGSFSFGGIDYKGKAQIRNVEFYHSGQEGWSEDYDPRYSVAFLNLEQVEDTYLQGCSFHDGFSPAIGVFNTEGLRIEDNVIHHTVGEGIRVWGHNTTLKRNLVMMTLWPGSYQDREEDFNYEWNAAIEVNKATSPVLWDNIVAGYERVAYRIKGEPCPGTPNDSEMWRRNEAHGGLFGVYLNKDGLPECSLIQDFFVWKSYDYGIYFQVTQSMVISNVTLVDNGLGVLSIIYTPASITHKYSDKRVTIESSLVVGSSPNFNCSQTLPTGDFNVINSATHRIGRHKTGGRSGVCLPNFFSDHNTAPMKPFPLGMSYNTIKGLMVVKDTTFVGFKEVCSGQENFMFITNTMNEDLQHPVHVSGVKMVDSSDNNKVFFHRADVGKVNPSDCVDMECDAKKKSLLKDLDGSFLGAVGAVVPHSEYEWDGDARRGLGDYRIPKVMLTFPNGSRIPVDQIAPNKGVIRKGCTYMAPWQSYSCSGLDYRLLVIESLDPDSETRRLSPVAVLGDGYVDLINGPQDHGWCAGYTCQRRLSLFHAIIALNHEFEVFFSSVSPQKLRLMLNTAGPSDSVLVSVFYSAPQRLDVYVDNKLVAPMNAQWNQERTDYILLEPQTPGQYVPPMNASVGSNFFEPEGKMLRVLVKGLQPVEVRMSPVLVLAFNLPAMTQDQFFGESLVQNLALFLKVPANMIRVTKIVRADGGRRRRRSTGLSVEVEIKQPPVQETTNATNDEEAFTVLSKIADDLGQAAVSGNLSQSIGFNVTSVGIIAPPPPASDPDWNKVATKEETREEATVSYVSSVSQLLLIQEPVSGVYVGPLSQQPSLKAVDEKGDCVSVGVTTLMITAALKDTSGNAVSGLHGNVTIKFNTCWANFTDLALSDSGENLTMVFRLKDWGAQSNTFTVRALPPTDLPTTNSTANSTTATPETGTGTGTTDSGTTDFGTTDSGTTDSGTTDSGTTDSGTPSTGTTDGTTDGTTTDGSIFSSGSTPSSSSLCAVSLVYAVAYCSEHATVF